MFARAFVDSNKSAAHNGRNNGIDYFFTRFKLLILLWYFWCDPSTLSHSSYLISVSSLAPHDS